MTWRNGCLCVVAASAVLVALLPPVIRAQAPAPVTLSAEQTAQLDTMLATIEQQRAEAAAIENRIAGADGVLLEILETRLQRERLDSIAEGVRFAEAVVARREAGFIVTDQASAAVEILETNLAVAQTAWTHLNERAAFPESGLSPAEQAARNRTFFENQRDTDRIIALIADSFELLGALGADVAAAEAAFEERLRERAINASVYLDLAQREAAGIRAGLSALPDDAELTAKLAVAESLIAQTASTLERVVGELADIGGDVSGYTQQLVSATGEITPAVFSFAVIRDLLSSWGQAVLDLVTNESPTFLLRLLVFALILLVFHRLSRVVRAVVEGAVSRSNAAVSQLLRRMIVSVVANLVLAVGVLIALSQIGISLGPLLAGLGIAGFVIGFALQDSLSNFASGLMILFYRPFDVGDVVEVSGASGRVENMSLVNTTIHTFDNQRIIVPNRMIWSGVIKNVTSQELRRVDMTFGISYSDDIVKTEQILKELIDAHELVLDEPAPMIRLNELADSSVNFIVRPWTRTEHYWDVYWDVTRAVKLRFDEEGISIPFPQRDVHLIGQAAALPQKSPTLAATRS